MIGTNLATTFINYVIYYSSDFKLIGCLIQVVRHFLEVTEHSFQHLRHVTNGIFSIEY